LLADAMLGRLARWLRILGYDTLYDTRWPDNELVRLARAQGRVLLTRDVALARRPGVRTLLVASEQVEEQLAQVVQILGCARQEALARCPVDNTLLEEAPHSWAWGYVPSYTFVKQDEFRLCPECSRFFWPGTHEDGMRRVIAGLRGARPL
jgi:uncharacterized protein